MYRKTTDFLPLGVFRDGEHLRWSGKPATFRFVRDGWQQILFWLIMSVFLALFAFLWSQGELKTVPVMPFSVLVVLPLFGGLLPAILTFISLLWKGKRLLYAVTNQRVILVERSILRCQVISYGKDELKQISIIERGPEYGDVVFDRIKIVGGLDLDSNDFRTVECYNDVGLLGIRDLRSVAAKVKEILN